MTYTIDRLITGATFDAVDARTRTALAANGFDPKVADRGMLMAAETYGANLEQAVGAGVFGVPTLVVDGELFWGEDATALFQDWLRDPGVFDTATMKRLDGLPVGTARKV